MAARPELPPAWRSTARLPCKTAKSRGRPALVGSSRKAQVWCAKSRRRTLGASSSRTARPLPPHALAPVGVDWLPGEREGDYNSHWCEWIGRVRQEGVKDAAQKRDRLLEETRLSMPGV